MTKRGIAILSIIFILLLVPVFSLDYFDYDSLTLKLTISNDFNFVQTGSGSYIEDASANLSLFPIDDVSQHIIDFNMMPETSTQLDTLDENIDSLDFYWVNPHSESLKAEFEIKTNYYLPLINKKESFPLKNIPASIYEYTQPTPIIDLNNEIRNLASNLAAGSDDQYIVVFNLADWVNKNIKYNLSSSNIEASKKSTEVIKTKQGVCDEITNLFISLNRALGIPARFVSGVAYTNLQGTDPWGPHGWAEVYFPGYGWIPFDVTYGEFGYIDAAHIKFRSTIDSNKSSINYEYKARNAKIRIGELLFNTEVINLGNKINNQLTINVDLWKNKVSIGSYNVVIAEILNNNPYYVAEEIYLANTQNIEYIDPNRKNVILKPFEKKTLAWIIKVDADLDQGYMYTFPIKIIGARDETASTEFTCSHTSPFYSYDEAKRMADSFRSQESTLPYSDKILLSCSSGSDFIYLSQELSFYCLINNTGSRRQNLNFCLDDLCESLEISGHETKIIEHKTNFSTPGIKTIIIKLQNSEVLKNNYLPINVYDAPSLKIIDAIYPQAVNYEDEFTIDFNVTKKSSSTPKNIKISLTNNVFVQNWNFESFNSDQNFKIKLKGSDLSAGKNNFLINMTYYDERHRLYSEERNFIITLENLDLAERLMIFMKNLGYKTEKILTNDDERSRFFHNPNTWIDIGLILVLIIIIKTGFYYYNKKKEREANSDIYKQPETKMKSE